MRQLALFIGVLTIHAAALAEPAIQGTPSELAHSLAEAPKTVAVTGEAEVRVPAHRAVLMLGVVTENRSLQEAMRMNAGARENLVAFLKKQGIPADRIQPSRFTSTPKFGIFGDKAKSYRVENKVRVAVQDDREFQGVAAAVDSFPELRYGGVEFEYADKEELKKKAIASACDNANERAKVYAEKLGLKLAPVSFKQRDISEQNASPVRYGTGRAYLSSAPSGPAFEAAAQEPPEESGSSFGELVYEAQVTVEYSATRNGD